MTAQLATRTQADRRAIAARARRHGFFRRSDLVVYVNCPLCRSEVDAYLEFRPGALRRETPTKALDRAMLAHLNNPDGCPGVAR